MGDLTGSAVVDSCAVAIMPRKMVIDASNIGPGLVIVGLSSSGKAVYEDVENSGIGSNGLTGARHDLMSPYYREKYPESFDQGMDRSLAYSGPHRLEDPLPGSSLTVGQAILSPTRTYAPVIVDLLSRMAGRIRGIIHCSGGGQTKCLRFGQKVHFVKNNLMRIPPIFLEIQKASGTSWREMFSVYNMGHRMEIYCEKADADAVIAAAGKFGIAAQVIGFTENSKRPDGGNHLTLSVKGENFSYCGV